MPKSSSLKVGLISERFFLCLQSLPKSDKNYPEPYNLGDWSQGKKLYEIEPPLPRFINNHEIRNVVFWIVKVKSWFGKVVDFLRCVTE